MKKIIKTVAIKKNKIKFFELEILKQRDWGYAKDLCFEDVTSKKATRFSYFNWKTITIKDLKT